MWRTMGAIVLAAAIEGKIKSVDVEGNKLTITIAAGRDRTFTITDETMMVGPRGGKVKKHLKDPRFHPGFPVTIVPDGNTADQVHLGFAKDATDVAGGTVSKSSYRPPSKADTVERSKTDKSTSTPPASPVNASKNIARHQESTKLEDEDDESEIPGHVKSFDETRHILVVTLFNGKTRSFIHSQNVPVHLKGATAASKLGLKDPQLKEGAFVTVVTDDGGHKVKELRIVPASEAKRRKAG